MTPERRCVYCRGEKVLDNTLHGLVACRVCLGTGNADPYENDFGHEARGRELRRIAELLSGRDHRCVAAITEGNEEEVWTTRCVLWAGHPGPHSDDLHISWWNGEETT